MEDQCCPFSWEYLYSNAEEGMEELKQALLYTTLELEKTTESAKEEITARELELSHLRNLLSKAIKERDEAISQYRSLLSEKPSKSSSQAEEEVSTEDPSSSPSSSSHTSSSSLTEEALEAMAGKEREKKKPLPEKGKLLQAVLEAGPLLQTLLLAGPLPQWQHPPPKMNSSDIPIPPWGFSPCSSKRAFGPELGEGFETPPSPKFRKVVFS
ncbi:uncharacterized protein LOC116195021 [Punica granatum]|uniref:Uncharacterized protein LOC116195021 n=1 Tax=Punica granatum TaxID=22663 RepID=A0A6P8CGG7_PUNGR|nr:uncharacterized protein LOC116195021 [Punica granatum]